jgi:very-short-patch-repair endonuclease
MDKKIKSPRHVAAGQARHAKLRADLGDDGYRTYQQQAHAAAIARHPGLASRAGKVGYRATVQKYGIEWARKRLAQANEANRTRRLANPTAGEQALCAELRRRGYTIHADSGQVFDYFTWMQTPNAVDYGQFDAIREAKIGHYYANVCLPAVRLILEVYGGVHQLNPARDAQRCAWLQEQGFVVVVITAEEATAPIRLAAVLDHLGGSIAGAAPTPFVLRPLRRRLAA